MRLDRKAEQSRTLGASWFHLYSYVSGLPDVYNERIIPPVVAVEYGII